MRILLVDIGTGTQDILLYDSRLDLENGYKLILPSPTMIIHRRIKAATRSGRAVLLTGHQMGGGPCAWAAETHAHAGLPLYALPKPPEPSTMFSIKCKPWGYGSSLMMKPGN